MYHILPLLYALPRVENGILVVVAHMTAQHMFRVVTAPEIQAWTFMYIVL